ncbi:hypothetical protein NDA01_05925 [Trichocoleus desertorum AS-A10]|uniref:hypothetical protein n=1 Tax=Trichocoleus TaxID=450526 RepID=UPI001F55A441|nr:hypothetical protein [Trichocoleus sp. FACHB-591]
MQRLSPLGKLTKAKDTPPRLAGKTAVKTILTIALIASLWAIAVTSDTIGLDTDLRLQMAHAWWTGTEEVIITPDMTPKVRGDIRFGVMGAGGKRYIAYEVGQSMLMLPGDWVGTQLHRLFPAIDSFQWRTLAVNFLIFIPLNAAAVVACFWLLRLFNFDEQVAGLTSATLFLATTVLHYAQIPQHNNQLLLLVTLGYAAALAYIHHRQRYFVLLSGLALGAALLIRSTSTLHVVTVLLFLASCEFYQSRNLTKTAQAVCFWFVGFLPLALLSRILDYWRYGNFWATGKFVEQQQLTTDPVWQGLPDLPANYPLINHPSIGILGALFSPAKSIFLYDPLLIPCLILGVVLWRKLHPFLKFYLVAGVINLGLHLLAYSRFVFWHGDAAWGARYHVTSVHLLLIPLLALFIQRLLYSRKLTAWVMRGLIVLAIAIQLTSVAMPRQMEETQTLVGAPGSRLQFRLGQRAINIACLANSSISDRCPSQLPPKISDHLKEYNVISLLPFSFSQQAKTQPTLAPIAKTLWVIWGVVVAIAIVSTVLYLRPLFVPVA